MVTAEAILHAASQATSGAARVPSGVSDVVDGRSPSVVIEPATVDAMSRALAWASDSHLSVVIRGAGTKDAWGRQPEPFDVLLRTTRLNRLIAHEASDMTATVEAGARLCDVNAQLRQHGQYLPFDPPSAGDATIGGVLAVNDTGPSRHRHGTPRDLLIGMTMVMPDGLVAASGGRVVKNVAGYDLARLLTGSHGCLAAIATATFKLVPLPPATRTLRLEMKRAADAWAIAELIRHDQWEPDALEFHVELRHNSSSTTVLVRYASVEAAVAAACSHTAEFAGRVGASAVVDQDTSSDDWWCAHDSDAHRHTEIRLAWKPADFCRAAEVLSAAAGDVAADWLGRLAVGSGLVRLHGDAERHAAIVTALRSTGVFRHVVLASSPAVVRRAVDVWDATPHQRILWQSLKNACDPGGVLGAGRGPL
jgi:glycolate oxidase FAD binding subunit